MTSCTPLATLRQQLRQQRQSLSPRIQQQHAQAAQMHFFQFLASYTQRPLRIGVFLAQDGELDTAPVIESFWQARQHTLFLPVLESNPAEYMGFAKYTPKTILQKNQFGILEPDLPLEQHQSGETLDLVLVPLVGFDANGNRLGMGGGYYDRTFSFKASCSKNSPPLLIGWAHSCQQVAHLSAEPWDIPLNGIVTNMGFSWFPISSKIS